MRPALPSKRDFLSAEDAWNISEAPRPCFKEQFQRQRQNTSSAVSSSHYTILSVQSSPSERSSVTSYTSSASKSQLAVPEIPRLTRTPWELERHKKKSSWRRTKVEPIFPAQVFKKLPREVYDCIVDQLDLLHQEESQSCPSCYLKDLHSLSLVSRAWDRAATARMYRNICVTTSEEHQKVSKLKIKGTSRLKLLRRTLRERPALGRIVRELRMSDFQSLYRHASIEKEEIASLVASLVMACPNLERLVGFHIPYDHSFDRLSHALSTRSQLKERVWILSEKTDDSEELDDDEDPSSSYYTAANDPTERFLELNASHSRLTTLVLHQEPNRSSTPLTFRALIGSFRQFPALRHLSISNLSSASFTNMALRAFPSNLLSLRLENLRGVNDMGLQRFAGSSLTATLESLSLVDMQISNFATIKEFLSPHLEHLRRFTFSQHKDPILPSSDQIPAFGSPTLSYIHWEIRSQAGPSATLLTPFPSRSTTPSFPFQNSEPISCLATSLLATNVRGGRFPSLVKIRAPHDPQGVLQGLCKPLANALLPSDAALFTAPRHALSASPLPYKMSFSNQSSVASSRHIFESSFGNASPSSSRTPSPLPSPDSAYFSTGKPSLDLPITSESAPSQSRLAAQARIIAARKQPFMRVCVTDPEGIVRVNKMVYGFLGQVGSKIEYALLPDRDHVQDTDDGDDDDQPPQKSEWITGIRDVLWECEEVGTCINRPAGCTHSGRAGMREAVVEARDLI